MSESKRGRVASAPMLPFVLWGQIVSFGGLRDVLLWSSTCRDVARYCIAVRDRLIAAPFTDYDEQVRAFIDKDGNCHARIWVPLGWPFVRVTGSLRQDRPEYPCPHHDILRNQVGTLLPLAKAIKKVATVSVSRSTQRFGWWSMEHDISYCICERLPCEQKDALPGRLEAAISQLNPPGIVTMKFLSAGSEKSLHATEHYEPTAERVVRMVINLRSLLSRVSPLDELTLVLTLYTYDKT